MKVLKPGREQRGWAEEHLCTGKGNGLGGCAAVLLVEQDDVFFTTEGSLFEEDGHARFNKFTIFNMFRCPLCGCWTDLGVVPFKPREQDPKRDGVASGAPLVTRTMVDGPD